MTGPAKTQKAVLAAIHMVADNQGMPEPDSVEPLVDVPPEEADSFVELPIRGYHVKCPLCRHELRVNRKFVGKKVSCKLCGGEFVLDFDHREIKLRKIAIYVYCPHCSDRLRMSSKYAGVKVVCKSCSGRLLPVE